MISFIVAIVVLILGYFFYGRLVEVAFGADAFRPTPAYRLNDGVDYVPLPSWKIFLIQFLNIAGLGPIFGAVAGAMWGPAAFLWIVLGCIFAGAVHDYLSGMISVRMDGLSIPEIVGKYLGNGFKQFMRIFAVFLMILVGAVFVMGPAGILKMMTGFGSLTLWAAIIFTYYLAATLLPIDKLIGRIYPVFGFSLLFMAFGIMIALLVGNHPIPEIVPSNLMNMHGQATSHPILPMLFITIACGAISGFHSTQSPLMARCIKNEKMGRRVFYGAMIAEGIVAMIWAAAAMAFFGGVPQLNQVMAEHQGNAAWAVNEISNSLLGKFGGFLALLGVVAAPITSGDTAFRSGRLIVADFLKYKQEKIHHRIVISAPLFALGILLTLVDFSIIWRYMAWSNQTLATIVLWTVTVYMAENRRFYWISFLPAIFMTMVVSTYLMIAPEGFRLPQQISYFIGASVTVISTAVFIFYTQRKGLLFPGMQTESVVYAQNDREKSNEQ